MAVWSREERVEVLDMAVQNVCATVVFAMLLYLHLLQLRGSKCKELEVSFERFLYLMKWQWVGGVTWLHPQEVLCSYPTKMKQ